MSFKKNILSVIYLFLTAGVLMGIPIETFDNIGGDVTFGTTPDGALLDPNNDCSNYPAERRAVYAQYNDSTVTYNGGSLKIVYTNKNNQGNVAVVKNFTGGADFSAYDYAMFYVKSSGVDDNFYFFVLEDNGPTSGPWSPIDDVWSYTTAGVVDQTNWMQVLVPLQVSSDGFVNASESWNSICYPSKFQQYNQSLEMTNVIAFEFAMQSPVASPSEPKYGTFWLDELYLLYASELIETSDPFPEPQSEITNPYTAISLKIGSDKTRIRMIVNNKEYTLSDSELSYSGDSIVFTPSSPLSGVVTVYADAVDIGTGMPIKAAKWWFIIGENIKADDHLLKILHCPEYMKKGQDTDLKVFLPSPGNFKVTLFSLSGRKIGDIADYDNITGAVTIRWNGQMNSSLLSSGLYLLELKYASEKADIVQRRILTIQLGDQ